MKVCSKNCNVYTLSLVHTYFLKSHDMCNIIFYYTVSYWNFQCKSHQNIDESSKEENVFRWPPQNILKWDKYNELPDLIDAHGRGHKMAIIKPSNSRVDTTEPDEIFESEEGDFSD